MDTVLLKTFLEVARLRHFGRTARIQTNVGFVTCNLIRDACGSAYLAEQVVDVIPVEPVRQSPLIERAAYMCYRIAHPLAKLLFALSKQLHV